MAAIVAAADTLRALVVDYFEGWEDAFETGEAVWRPGEFREPLALFTLAEEAARIARVVADDHSVSTALAAEAL